MNFNSNSFSRGTPASTMFVTIAEIIAVISVAFLMMIPDAHAQSGNVYGSGQAQVYSQAEEATVLQTRRTVAESGWQTRTAGAGIGGIVGALLGREASNNHVVASLFATAGALGGERIANAVMSKEAQEIVLQLGGRNGTPGRIITIVQPAPFDAVLAGEQVFLVNTAGTYRVIKRQQQPVTFFR